MKLIFKFNKLAWLRSKQHIRLQCYAELRNKILACRELRCMQPRGVLGRIDKLKILKPKGDEKETTES